MTETRKDRIKIIIFHNSPNRVGSIVIRGMIAAVLLRTPGRKWERSGENKLHFCLLVGGEGVRHRENAGFRLVREAQDNWNDTTTWKIE
jgi:hypothetical protein